MPRRGFWRGLHAAAPGAAWLCWTSSTKAWHGAQALTGLARSRGTKLKGGGGRNAEAWQRSFPAWASAEPASRLRKSHPHRPPESPPYANDPVPGQSRQQNRQKLALARLILRWQDTRKMNASENQFSLTRATPSTSGRAKPNSYPYEKQKYHFSIAPLLCFHDGDPPCFSKRFPRRSNYILDPGELDGGRRR